MCKEHPATERPICARSPRTTALCGGTSTEPSRTARPGTQLSSTSPGRSSQVQTSSERLASTHAAAARAAQPPVGPGHVDPVEPAVAELGALAAQGDQVAVERQQPGVRLGRELGPVQPGPGERLRVLRVGHLVLGPAVRAELRLAAGGRRGRDPRVGVVGEELPRRRGTPLLPHEQHRRPRRGQQDRGPAGEQAGLDGGREPVALGPVADLVVGLERGDEPRPGHGGGVDRAAVLAAPEGGERAVVEERRAEHLGQGLAGRRSRRSSPASPRSARRAARGARRRPTGRAARGRRPRHPPRAASPCAGRCGRTRRPARACGRSPRPARRPRATSPRAGAARSRRAARGRRRAAARRRGSRAATGPRCRAPSAVPRGCRGRRG